MAEYLTDFDEATNHFLRFPSETSKLISWGIVSVMLSGTLITTSAGQRQKHFPWLNFGGARTSLGNVLDWCQNFWKVRILNTLRYINIKRHRFKNTRTKAKSPFNLAVIKEAKVWEQIIQSLREQRWSNELYREWREGVALMWAQRWVREIQPLFLSGPWTPDRLPAVWPSTPAGGCTAPYLVNTLGVLQPGVVHFLHVVGARPIQERLWGHRCSVAPDWLKRPCTTCGGDCDWPLLADSLSRLRGGERTQSRRTSP